MDQREDREERVCDRKLYFKTFIHFLGRLGEKKRQGEESDKEDNIVFQIHSLERREETQRRKQRGDVDSSRQGEFTLNYSFFFISY